MSATADGGDVAAVRRVAAVLAARLAAAGARDEALATHRPARRLLGVLPRPAVLAKAGRVWRLGDYLVTPEGELLRTGRVVRVAGTDRRRSVVAEAITQHHALAVAARRGGHREGETVNFDADPVDPGSLDPVRLEAYLAERAELLVHPPERA